MRHSSSALTDGDTKRVSGRRRWLIAALIAIGLGVTGGLAYERMARAKVASCQNACISNLRIIDSAKQQWALEQHRMDGEILNAEDLRVYMGCGHGDMPTCPSAGQAEFTNTYEINPVGQPPTCKIHPQTHRLSNAIGP